MVAILITYLVLVLLVLPGIQLVSEYLEIVKAEKAIEARIARLDELDRRLNKVLETINKRWII